MQNLDAKKYSLKTFAKLYRFRWPRQDRDSEQHAEIDIKHLFPSCDGAVLVHGFH